MVENRIDGVGSSHRTGDGNGNPGCISPVELSLFSNRVQSVCDEMGAALKRAAFSPNIKDRLDFSCALFDGNGQLTAQAAHIPVHLGSMAFAMESIVNTVQWKPGDMVVVNDPYKGGTHLPDVTLIAPVYLQGIRVAFVANRAHHANIGASSPGSMPVSTHLQQEGIVIPPTHIQRQGEVQQSVLFRLAGLVEGEDSKSKDQANFTPPQQSALGDFKAQMSANRIGVERLLQLIQRYGVAQFNKLVEGINDYAQSLALASLKTIPDGRYRCTDWLDDDGAGTRGVQISAELTVAQGDIEVDFAGTAAQVNGNVNCPLSVAAAAIFYCLRCLMPEQMPVCAGAFRGIRLRAAKGSLLNAEYPAAVAAGNVETSTRVVDVVLGALAQAIPNLIPAASQGSMNNLAMGGIDGGGESWDYYETMGGGMGASSKSQGLSAVQTHMTNTLNTPVESLESHYPIQLTRYQVRRGSGGQGFHSGGDGIIREFRFTQPATVTLLTERRARAPWGAQGGKPGKTGNNFLNAQPLPAKISTTVAAGDVLCVETPGGGGWGKE